MALYLNRVTLVGNVGKDPELRHAPNGTAVANFSLATTNRWTDKQGARQEKTTWHRVAVWERLAELVMQVVHKGAKVLVEGELCYRPYVDAEGRQREGVHIRAGEIISFTGARDRQAAGLPGRVNAEPVTTRDEEWPGLPDTEEVPF